MSDLLKDDKKTPFWSWGGLSRKSFLIYGLLAFVAHVIFYWLYATFQGMGVMLGSNINPYATGILLMIFLMVVVKIFVIFLATKRLVDAGILKRWVFILIILLPFLVALPPLSLVVVIILSLLPSKKNS